MAAARNAGTFWLIKQLPLAEARGAARGADVGIGADNFEESEWPYRSSYPSTWMQLLSRHETRFIEETDPSGSES